MPEANAGSFRSHDCRDCLRCMFCSGCTNCYRCTHCTGCEATTGSSHCLRCTGCHDCSHCQDSRAAPARPTSSSAPRAATAPTARAAWALPARSSTSSTSPAAAPNTSRSSRRVGMNERESPPEFRQIHRRLSKGHALPVRGLGSRKLIIGAMPIPLHEASKLPVSCDFPVSMIASSTRADSAAVIKFPEAMHGSPA